MTYLTYLIFGFWISLFFQLCRWKVQLFWLTGWSIFKTADDGELQKTCVSVCEPSKWASTNSTVVWADRRLRRQEGGSDGEPLFPRFPSSHLHYLTLLFRVPPSLATLCAWYNHSLDKHSSTMRSPKCFLLSSWSKVQQMPLVSAPWWELWVCFQFRVIPGTHRFLSKNRQQKVDMRRRARGEEGGGEEGSLVNEHQMPYLRW